MTTLLSSAASAGGSQARSKSARTVTVLGIGGTLRPGSSSEQALRIALSGAAERGAAAEILTARDLHFPMYDPGNGPLDAAAERFINAVRRADGLIIATPGYHGGTSGLLKNALDYLQELAGDPTPYLDGKAVGCLVTASGWQAGGMTLSSLRATVHSLRGWPTPLGVVINSSDHPFGPDGSPADAKIAGQLTTLGMQVVSFARAQLAVAS
jgi:FMN reductase